MKKNIISRSFSTQTKTIKSLYDNSKTREARKHVFNQADSAANLIAKQENVNSSLSIYNMQKNKSISVIAAMTNVYKKHNHPEEVQKMCKYMISVHNKMKNEGKRVTSWDWDRLIQTLCQCQWNKEGIFFFEQMIQEEEPHPATVYWVLKSLVQLKNLEYITSQVIPLIDRRNMRLRPQVYNDVIKLCSQVAHVKFGEVIHGHLIRNGIKNDPFINTALINMYGKYKNLNQALKIFNGMQKNEKDVVIWNAMISACNANGKGEEALDLYEQMQSDGVKATAVTYNTVLTVCADLARPDIGEKIHRSIPQKLLQDVFVGNALINMYGKCGQMGKAFEVFNQMKKDGRNVVAWNSVISACNANGEGEKALDLYEQMQSDGIIADATTYQVILTVCADLARPDIGEKIHKSIPHKLLQDIFVRTALINMYGKCGQMGKAFGVFNQMQKNEKDVVIWTAMISACNANGKGEEALDLYEQMQSDGVKATAVTYNTVLTVCADLARPDIGEKIHKSIPQKLLHDVFVRTALINMYSKCGELGKAFETFNQVRNEKDIVTWTAMISAFGANGKGEEALDLYEQMQSDGVKATAVTYNTVLTVCADLARPDIGEKIHRSIPQKLLQDVFVGNALINMYGKCGQMEKAFEVFNQMKKDGRNVFTWTSMISACNANGKGEKALDLYEQMQSDGIIADATTYQVILTVCADLARPDIGEKIHRSIPHKLLQDVFVRNALINMYGKCGELEKALEVFNGTKKNERNIVTWTAMISAYGSHGMGRQALELFEQMKADGLSPTSITFVALLTACSHSGLINEAQELFDFMDKVYGVTPDDMHLSCLIDALGRAGELEKAEMYMNETKNPNIVALSTVLGACRSRGDVVRAERIFSKIVALDPLNASAYVMMANIYALAQRVEDANKIRLLMRRKQIKKTPGLTTIVVDGISHSFASHDTSHPKTKEIYEALHTLHSKMIGAGYEADTSWVTRTDVHEEDYSQEKKKEFLCYHSERIAIGFALISTPEGTPITLVKNLRVCGDCHNATKYIAMVTSREITVRDASRFHHFTPDGKCSCGDYW